MMMDETLSSTQAKILALLVHRFQLEEIATMLDMNAHIVKIQVDIIASLIGEINPAQSLAYDTENH
jgi:hypothetical protein